MAPFRASRSTRSGRPGGQTDHDVFDGLPVRQWKLQETTIQPPAPEAQNAFGLAQAAPQESIPGKPFDKWAVERPLPKGTELYAPWCQQILRAARAGKIAKKKDPAAVVPREGEEKENEEESNGKDVGQKVFTAKKWLQTPRHLEEPEREYLAKRRKGLTSAFALTAEGTVINIAPVEQAPVVEERRRNIPPRRKPKKGFQKKKKMSDGAGLGVSASAEALAAQKEAEAQAAAHNDGDTPMHDDDDGEEDDEDDDADDGDEDDGDAETDGDGDGDADDGEGTNKETDQSGAKQADAAQETSGKSMRPAKPKGPSEDAAVPVLPPRSPKADDATTASEQAAPAAPNESTNANAEPVNADLSIKDEVKVSLEDYAQEAKEDVAAESYVDLREPPAATVPGEVTRQEQDGPEADETGSTEQSTTSGVEPTSGAPADESPSLGVSVDGNQDAASTGASLGAPIKAEAQSTADPSAQEAPTTASVPAVGAETNTEPVTKPDTQPLDVTKPSVPSQEKAPDAQRAYE